MSEIEKFKDFWLTRIEVYDHIFKEYYYVFHDYLRKKGKKVTKKDKELHQYAYKVQRKHDYRVAEVCDVKETDSEEKLTKIQNRIKKFEHELMFKFGPMVVKHLKML